MNTEHKVKAKQRLVKYVNSHGMPRESQTYNFVHASKHLTRQEFDELIIELVAEGKIARIESHNAGCHFLLPTEEHQVASV